VFTVARNRIIDFYRERARRRAASDGLVEAGATGPDVTSVDLSGALEVLMSRLSEQDREALRAVDLEGLSQKQYADSLGLNYVTAKSRVQRARKRLRREFERCCTVVLDRRGAPLECTPRHRSMCCEAC
jgi:RNA polymerase sigma-70 factor (ECF subfamily)